VRPGEIQQGQIQQGEIRVENLSRRFRVRVRGTNTLKSVALLRSHSRPVDVWALRGVSFDVEPGSGLALIGRNGSGKSTLLRVVAGIIKPTQGRVDVGGRIGTLLELGAGFHPDFTGRENVYLNGSILGLKRAYIRERFDEIVAFAELEDFIDVPVRTYSSGMFMRLGFAVASHLNADVLLLDEVFAVGDGAFQRKCLERILEFKRNGGTIVFVSHDSSAVERLCERAILLRDGRVTFDGATHDALTEYHALLADERDPAERAGGLTEWGSGEARIRDTRVCGSDGEEREHLGGGDPFSLRLMLAVERAIAPPRLSYELRDEADRLLAGGALDTADVGWPEAAGQVAVRFDVPSLPLAHGHFHFALSLAAPESGHVYHRVEHAAPFAVYPGGGERGAVLLDGTWTGGEIAAAAEVNTS
jgi:ABC-type polysaccharide/polyol phosphate transport system ATPase subunit